MRNETRSAWAPLLLRRASAWMVTAGLAIALPGAPLDVIVLLRRGVPAPSAIAAGLAALGLAGWLALGLGLLLALAATAADKLAHVRSPLRFLWPFTVAALEVAAAFHVTHDTRGTHPALHLMAMGCFIALVVGAAMINVVRWRAGGFTAVAVVTLGLIYADVRLPPTLYIELHDLLALAATCTTLAMLGRLRGWLRDLPRNTLIMIWAGVAACSWLITERVDDLAPGWRVAAWLYGNHASRTARACRALVDFDGDGFSPVAWGSDCDDFDPERNPLAHDGPGLGDRDCNGIDPPAHPNDDQRGLEPPFGDPDLAPGAVDTVVFITVDTMRADVFDARVTPRLVALATAGIHPSRTYSAGSRTRVSMPLLQHTWSDGPTVAAMLHAAGVTTSMVLSLSDPQLLPLTAGMDEEQHPTSGEWPAAEVTDRALADLHQHRGQPHFLWIHYIDAHFPYQLSAGKPLQYVGDKNLPVSFRAYLTELSLIDEQIGRILDDLTNAGVMGRTAIVVTSDHGEGFGEHGVTFHGVSGFEQLIRVPALLVAPGVAPLEYAELASHRDIPPTLLGLYGLVRTHPEVERFGRSWLRLRGQPSPLHTFTFTRSAAYAVGDTAQMPMGVIVDARGKLVKSYENGLVQMYDLGVDPDERDDIAPFQPEREERLMQALELYRDIDPP